MGCLSIPFRRLPHQPKLFVRFIEDFPGVARFYAHPPTFDSVKRVAVEFDFPADRRQRVASILSEQNVAFGAGSATHRHLDLLGRGAVAVATGQQAGLFSGPAFAFYKALTAIQIARELSDSGLPAVPIFWMATEDHDLDEVRHISWFEGGKLERFELPGDGGAAHPVGQVPLGPGIEDLTRRAASLLSGPAAESVARVLLESYTSAETYGSAFAKLFARIFTEQGLILLDPLDPRLHRVAAPVYRKALENRDALNESLLQRGQELESAGFEPQVKVTAKSTLLFTLKDGERQSIAASDGRFQAAGQSWSREEILRFAESAPETFSPNALLRPVVQDYLLPTVADIGGPAEISYLAQSAAIYPKILGRVPVLMPRADFTLIDAKADKILRKFNLCIEDLWAAPQELRRKMESVAIPPELARDFAREKAEMEKTLTNLGEQIVKLDASLGGAVETAQKKITFQLENLQSKTGRALDERKGIVESHVQFIESLLYPNRQLQARELCFLPFLARWGMEGLAELQKLCGAAAPREHRIVRIP